MSSYFKIFILTLGLILSKGALADYLLKPTGKFGVGYEDIYLINKNICPDKFFSDNQNDFSPGNSEFCHEIYLRVFYPTDKAHELRDKYYSPALKGNIIYYKTALNLSKADEKSLDSLFEIKTYTARGEKISQKNVNFPIVLFMPGSGMSVHSYINIVSELVSNGYVVMGINSLFANGPLELSNGHVVMPPSQYRDESRLQSLEDLKFVLKQINVLQYNKELKKQINFNNMSLMGHSMGAMSIVNLVKQNSLPQIKAILLMDPGNILEGANYPIRIKKIPLMVIWASKFKQMLGGSTNLESNQSELVLKSPTDDLNYCNHQNFGDLSTMQYHPALQLSPIRSFLTNPKNLGVGSGDGYVLSKMINKNIVQFFDRNQKYFLKSR